MIFLKNILIFEQVSHKNGGKGVSGIIRKEFKNSDLLFIAAFAVLVLGVILGSVYLAYASSYDGIKSYLDGFLQSCGDNACFSVFKKSLRGNLAEFLFVFIAGFFKFGALFSAAAVIRRGFIIGFTVSSFVKLYGMKGLLFMSSTMPVTLIIIPAFLIFAAVSVNFSVSKEKNQKKFLISYIFFGIFIFTIFCIASLGEGYVTTTFMKWILPKIG